MRIGFSVATLVLWGCASPVPGRRDPSTFPGTTDWDPVEPAPPESRGTTAPADPEPPCIEPPADEDWAGRAPILDVITGSDWTGLGVLGTAIAAPDRALWFSIGLPDGEFACFLDDNGEMTDHEMSTCGDDPVLYGLPGVLFVDVKPGDGDCKEFAVFDGTSMVTVPFGGRDEPVEHVASGISGERFVSLLWKPTACFLATWDLSSWTEQQLPAEVCTEGASLAVDPTFGTIYVANGDLWGIEESDVCLLVSGAGDRVAFEPKLGSVVTSRSGSDTITAYSRRGASRWSKTLEGGVLNDLHALGDMGGLVVALGPPERAKLVLLDAANGDVTPVLPSDHGEDEFARAEYLDVSADGSLIVLVSGGDALYRHSVGPRPRW